MSLTVESGGRVSSYISGGFIRDTASNAEVSHNSVSIAGKAGASAFGGYNSGLGVVSLNSITVEVGGEVTAEITGGFVSNVNSQAKVSSNSVIIRGKSLAQVTGGHTRGLGDVSDNKVSVESSAEAGAPIYGGIIANRGSQATLFSNTVSFNGKTASLLYGAYTSGLGNVNSNHVVVDIEGEVGTNISGGVINNRDSSAKVSENTIIIKGKVGSYVSGGESTGTGDLEKNTVLIDGAVGGDAFGGWGYGNLSFNAVTIDTNGKVSGDIFGGYSAGNGNVGNNSINISGTASKHVHGGYAAGNGNVANNSVDVSGRVDQNVYGGLAKNEGNVTENHVDIRDTATTGGSVLGGYSDGSGEVARNSVVVDGRIDQSVYGGNSSGSGNVTNNSVDINGTVSQEVYGGYANSSGNVTNNSVDISGTVASVYGGFSESSGKVEANNIIISGTVSKDVYAGFSALGVVNNNAVYITSTANLASASLYGFNSGATGTGNMLSVNGFSGDVVSIANFDTYNFALGTLAANQTFINITGNDPVNIDDSAIHIDFTPLFNGSIINVGDTITVISKINPDAKPASVTVKESPFIAYSYSETHNETVAQNKFALLKQPYLLKYANFCCFCAEN